MLKTATIFKDFKIAANSTNTAVTFQKNGGLSVKVKNDNFAEQVEILDEVNDLFDYKYITFDDSAVFEITDAIKNGNYTTIFIQYLSNISFDAPDDNFRVDAVSARRLQDLGLDLNQFIEILGNKLIFSTTGVNGLDLAEVIVPAVKIRFSELPEILKANRLSAEGGATDLEPNGYERTSPLHNPLISNKNDNLSFLDFRINEDASVCLLIIPPRNPSRLIIRSSPLRYQDIQLEGFFSALSKIVSDLVLSIEVTLINSKSLYTIAAEHFGNINLTKRDMLNSLDVTLPTMDINRLNEVLWGVRLIDDFPIITNRTYGSQGAGFYESFNFIKMPLETGINKNLLQIKILDNTINLSAARNDHIYIKRKSCALLVYIDLEKNLYEEIQTTLEFVKNAYSNYEAYQKSNIDLINGQEMAALKQSQEQQRQLQNFEHLATGAKSLGGALFSFGMGNITGGIGMLAGAGASMAIDEKKHNLKTQNDIANQRLKAAQAHERATAVITPTSELKGSVDFKTAFYINNITLVIFEMTFVSLTAAQLEVLQKYVFENSLLEKITDVAQIQKPEWASSYYQARICNRSALNTRKDLIVFVEE